MSSSASKIGSDFLYAQLHAWWSVSAQGEALEALCRSVTVDNFLHELQNRRILTVRDAEHVNFAFLLRQYDRLSTLAREVGGAMGDFVLAHRTALTIENFKALLNYRFFPERVGRVGDVLVPYPDRSADANLLEDVMAATDTEQFIRLLPKSLTSIPGLSPIIRQLDKDRNLVAAMSAIDRIINQRQLEAMECLSGVARETARELHAISVDCTNAIALLRNHSFYHLSAEELRPFWLDGGARLRRHQWERLAETPGGELSALLSQLPYSLQRAAQPQQTPQAEGGAAAAGASAATGVSAIENRLRCLVAAKARVHFYNAGEPDEALPAYLWLLEFESTNLRRIHEALRFSMPIQEITAMLIA